MDVAYDGDGAISAIVIMGPEVCSFSETWRRAKDQFSHSRTRVHASIPQLYCTDGGSHIYSVEPGFGRRYRDDHQLRMVRKLCTGVEGGIELKCNALRKGSRQITIKMLTGNQVTLIVSGRDTVEDLQVRIQNSEGIPADQQRLIFEGVQLEHGKTLDDYGVTDFTLIHLVLRLRGGMYHSTSARHDFDAEDPDSTIPIHIFDCDKQCMVTVSGNPCIHSEAQLRDMILEEVNEEARTARRDEIDLLRGCLARLEVEPDVDHDEITGQLLGLMIEEADSDTEDDDGEQEDGEAEHDMDRI